MQNRQALSLSLQWGRMQAAQAIKAVLPRHTVVRAIHCALRVGLQPLLAVPTVTKLVTSSATSSRAAREKRRPKGVNQLTWQLQDISAEITLRMVDADEGRSLNHDFRGKDYATNVLTFDYTRPPAAPVVAADIILCVPVLLQEAQDLGKPVRDHFLHLIVHGVLHACGYDHETSEVDADAMEALEIKALAQLGVGNPYNQRSD